MPLPDLTATAYKTPLPGLRSLSIMGPLIHFIASGEQTSDQFSVLDSAIAPGVVVPLHSHPETELLYALDGSLQVLAYQGSKPHWLNLNAGESVIIPTNARHAIRNVSNAGARVLLITAARMGHFFEEIGAPLGTGEPAAPPSPELMQAFLSTASRYDFWMGSPEENAAVGIKL